MIAEVLLVLAGHSSSLFPTDHTVHPAFAPLLHPGEQQCLESLGQIAARYRKIKDACATLSRSPSRYSAALCATLNQILRDEYENLVVETEAKVLRRDASLVASGSFVPLSSIRATFAEWDAPLAALEKLVEDLQDKRYAQPGPLVDLLLTRSHTGIHRIASIYSRLCDAVQRVWIAQLQAFVVHGTVSDKDPLASKDYTLLEGSVPSCLSAQSRESIAYLSRRPSYMPSPTSSGTAPRAGTLLEKKKKLSRTAGMQASAGTPRGSAPRQTRTRRLRIRVSTASAANPGLAHSIQGPADGCGRMAYRLHAEHGARAAPRMHCVYACWTTGRAPLKYGDIVNIRASVVRTAWRDIPGNTESPLHGGPVRWLHNRGGRYAPPPAMPIRPRSETISRLQSARHGQHHAQRPAGTTHLSTVAAESQAHGKATRRVPLVISSPRSARRGVGSAAAKSQTRIRVRFCCSRFAVIATVQTRLTHSSAFDHARRAVPPSAAHAHAPHPCAITRAHAYRPSALDWSGHGPPAVQLSDEALDMSVTKQDISPLIHAAVQWRDSVHEAACYRLTPKAGQGGVGILA
ncbi:hypothetical protein POSPLADRAFT_1175650 [Postia placenta MAD-698-R-SB12]|uniref:Spindle pole body component n=1 Tax=Postia placenta MAD-698-R-SB12 TaxID=670580 RepID=A0A1X6NE70_9APHY|nr:hypothetical protein POSPLADRAFT_1175650 [Postia placenta MAD-698-R-SB12]OSX66935.1 hypothetical protein POSPLADRAFT_1175650 [Postia placenta MAD-698-R-SB12]